MTYLEETAFML